MGLFRSLFGLLFILSGLGILAVGLDRVPDAPDDIRQYGTYVGSVFILFGFVLGKYWSVQIKPKRAAPRVETATRPLEVIGSIDGMKKVETQHEFDI